MSVTSSTAGGPAAHLSNAVSIKQASVRLTDLLADEVAWASAAAIADTATHWSWTAAGAQLGRIGAAHREHDPVSPPPQHLDKAPRRPRDEEEYGFDAAGVVIAHREWIAGDGPRAYAYERGEAADDLVFRWDAAGRPAGIELLSHLPGGRLAHTVDINMAGECFAERYAWRGTTLEVVELLAVSISRRPQARRVRVTDRFVYAGR